MTTRKGFAKHEIFPLSKGEKNNNVSWHHVSSPNPDLETVTREQKAGPNRPTQTYYRNNERVGTPTF